MALEIVTQIPIESITHPHYSLRMLEWYKWRLTFEGGWIFINEYLQQRKAESQDDFTRRKKIAYCPAFAKAAVRDVISSIYGRFRDITRIEGSRSYRAAIMGQEAGVDLSGTSMNTFMGAMVLPELCIMGKVGVYVDMPIKRGTTVLANKDIRPYLYVYKAEDIRSWEYDDSPTPNIYKALLLRDTVFIRDAITKLPTGTTHQYRYYYRDEDDGTIWVQFYNENSQPIDPTGQGNTGPIQLNIPRIPFVTAELSNSLMADIADYQIALLNLASSTLSFGIDSNFPFYTEQFDPRAYSGHLQDGSDAAIPAAPSNGSASTPDEGGVVGNGSMPSHNIKVGVGYGRMYAKGLERPQFVNPSAESLKSGMDLEEQLKMDIRLLINLSITNLNVRATSAESRGFDERSLEAGLCYIGAMCEDAERQIAYLWHMYENDKEHDIATIRYPDKFNVQNQKDVWAEVEEYKKQIAGHCSITFQRCVAKRIADLLLLHRYPPEMMEKIYKEIDESETVDIAIDQLTKDVQTGILDPDYAGKLRGYPEGTAKKAQEAQVKRLEMIKKAQQPEQGMGAAANNGDGKGQQNPGARGNTDESVDPQMETQMEKDKAGNPTRGKGANNTPNSHTIVKDKPGPKPGQHGHVGST